MEDFPVKVQTNLKRWGIVDEFRSTSHSECNIEFKDIKCKAIPELCSDDPISKNPSGDPNFICCRLVIPKRNDKDGSYYNQTLLVSSLESLIDCIKNVKEVDAHTVSLINTEHSLDTEQVEIRTRDWCALLLKCSKPYGTLQDGTPFAVNMYVCPTVEPETQGRYFLRSIIQNYIIKYRDYLVRTLESLVFACQT